MKYIKQDIKYNLMIQVLIGIKQMSIYRHLGRCNY